ncbi:MAG: cytochrome c-type biogenesis protein CcmH [Gammaproteobacteria bacterium]|nr:cytochrome c-type biogenesis protein CcmH [Gammaproteobacteria bacterium]NKB62809.1 cytochrome c-type biogenesis protein CcmH [Gammaproteobacteria bacterium]
MCKSIITAFLLTISIPFFTLAHGQQEIFEFGTPEQEAIYQTMIKELRCLVCQNQNLADSNAGLAQDLRRKTHEMVVEGKSQGEIAKYMVDRYGEFVLYRPTVSKSTFILWFSPFILLALLIFLSYHFIRKARRRDELFGTPSDEYDEDQLVRVKSLMQDKE